MSPSMRVPSTVQKRVDAGGEVGRMWLAGLDALVASLAADWGLTLGRTLTGGTAALVLEARTAGGEDAVLKLAVAGQDPEGNALKVLLRAKGRGYASVLRHDEARGAMLLERLGPTLESLSMPVEAKEEAVCATLLRAWEASADGGSFPNGAEKARSMAELIEGLWHELGRPCSERAVEVALAFCDDRERAYDPAHVVLAHGDAHPHNTLQVPGADPAAFKFIDPEGLLIEPAYDLAIPMREWGDELLKGDPVALGHARCERLARFTGVDPGPIWQWGFIERVGSGLYLKKLGLHEWAPPFLKVADAWAAAEA